MANDYVNHPFDLDAAGEELELFAEEVGDAQRHDLPPNSLSTFACECDISTFFCYGCGVASVKEVSAIEDIGDFESALKWTRSKMSAPAGTDKAAEVIQSLFRAKRG